MSDESTLNQEPGNDDTNSPQPPSFHESLPDDIRNNEALANFEDAGSLAKAYLEKANYVEPPEVPEGPEKYDYGEGISRDDPILQKWSSLAHELGLSNAKSKKVVEWYQGTISEVRESYKAQREKDAKEAYDAMKKEWGASFDENAEIARKAVDTFGGADLRTYLAEKGMDNDPVLSKLFLSIGKAISEDTWIQGAQRQPGPKRGVDGKAMLSFPSMDEK